MNNVATILQLMEGLEVESGRHVYTVVLRLPTGDQMQAEVPYNVYRSLHALLDTSPRKAEEPRDPEPRPVSNAFQIVETVEEHPPSPDFSPQPAVEEELTDEQKEMLDATVKWRDLPDNVLDPLMKKAMDALGFEAVATLREVYELADKISREFSAEDWDQVRGTHTEVLATAPAPQQQVGVPTWSEGAPSVPGVRQRRVQADAKGNPIVAGRHEVDPGETVAEDEEGGDEDGVPTW